MAKKSTKITIEKSLLVEIVKKCDGVYELLPVDIRIDNEISNAFVENAQRHYEYIMQMCEDIKKGNNSNSETE